MAQYFTMLRCLGVGKDALLHLLNRRGHLCGYRHGDRRVSNRPEAVQGTHDVDGADDEIKRRWASLKAAIIKPTDLEVGHGNSAELKDQILSDGWKCILDDKTANWYRKVTVTEESPAKKAAEMRMETFATVPKPLQSTD
eukprot:7378355-Prymnesium_polylepis.1